MFIQLLRARPECFDRPRFILGDPWNNEPYGYCCENGKQAFLAINNCTWSDQVLDLKLGPAWGLPEDGRWQIYRWHPRPARLTPPKAQDAFGPVVPLALRPFEIVLLEVVPVGQAPARKRDWHTEALPSTFEESTVALRLTPEDKSSDQFTRLVADLPPTGSGGRIAVTYQGRGLESVAAAIDGEPVNLTRIDRGYQRWEGWRGPIGPAPKPRRLVVDLKTGVPRRDVNSRLREHFIPQGPSQ